MIIVAITAIKLDCHPRVGPLHMHPLCGATAFEMQVGVVHCQLTALIFICWCRFLKWFKRALKGVESHLIRKSRPSNLTFVGEELQSGEFYAKMVGICATASAFYVVDYDKTIVELLIGGNSLFILHY